MNFFNRVDSDSGNFLLNIKTRHRWELEEYARFVTDGIKTTIIYFLRYKDMGCTTLMDERHSVLFGKIAVFYFTIMQAAIFYFMTILLVELYNLRKKM